MIQTSSTWKEYVKESSVFHIKATMTGGSTLQLTDDDFMLGTTSFTDSMSGMNEIALGAVVTNTFNATLNNNDGKFDNWDWTEIEVWFGIEVNGSEEWIKRGKYTIDRPSSIGNTIKIECYDYMDKLNTYYSLVTDITYPLEASRVVYYMCQYCGVDYDFTGTTGWQFSSSFNVNTAFADLNDEATTCRQVLSWILQTMGGYARINPSNGKLECKKWNIGTFDEGDDIDGGTFNPWSVVEDIDGGSMNPWSVVTDYYGGFFIAGGDYTLEKVKQQTIMIDDITVTGVRAFTYNTVDEFDFATAGSGGYILAIQDNPLVGSGAGNDKQTIANRAWANLEGVQARPFNATIFGDPSIEAGDRIGLVDKRGRYVSTITSLTFTLGGDMRVSCDLETPDRNSLQTANPTTSAIKGAVTAAYDYITAKKISADYITAGTIEAAVIAKNFTMDGGSINVHTQGRDDNVIELEWETDILSRSLKLTPTSTSITAHTDMTSISWDDSTSLVAGGFTIHRDRSDNNTLELKYQGDGQLFMFKNETANVNLNADGTCYARSWTTYSLEEYKKSINKIDTALEKINTADIVEYNFKDEDTNTKKHIGLAVGKTFNAPQEVIATDENGNEVGVDLYAMVSLAWKAIQEQSEKIEALEKRVAELESLNEKKEK